MPEQRLNDEIFGPKVEVDKQKWRDVFVRQFMEPVLTIVLPLLLLSVVVLAVMVQDVRSDAESRDTAAAERGYTNRAETCRIQVALGIPLDGDCLDPHITTRPDGTPRYDPNATPTAGSTSPGQVRNLTMLCAIEEAIGVTKHPDCP